MDVIDAFRFRVQLGRVERRITMSIRNLKTILVADAATCVGVFAAGLLAAEPVGALLGLPAQVVAIGGWICLAAALLMIVAARQAVPATALVKLIALGNLGWVAASFAVIAAFAAQMTGLGIAAVAVQALGVLGFAILEWKSVAGSGAVAAA
ncbi:hypothetical protein Sala_1233 [Sphingopyxis alaskensis RB2256]|uniref:Integral membrane protein n=2 Tax=Sphingopyxis alaskensis TaxID=117207 RepID=Q1GTS4_SPHAL|nr:hypothetical protein Sala_1233 [Sphingopyxis alaskensis RB2256]